MSCPGSEAKARSDLQRGECPGDSSSCPSRYGWVLVLAKEQSRGRAWRFAGDVVAELLPTAPQVFGPVKGKNSGFLG